MEVKKRLHWIDAARGMAMILVVAGHLGLRNQFVQWIYSFHMPLFFILSGMTMKSAGGDTEHPIKEICRYTISKVRTYLVPYIIFAFIFSTSDSIFRTLIAVYGSREALVIAETKTVLWFLPACFCANVIYKACLILTRGIREEIMDGALFAAGILLSLACGRISISIGYPLSLNLAMMAISYIAIGRLLGKGWTKLVGDSKRRQIAVMLICGAASVVLYRFNLPVSVTEGFRHVEMSVGSYGNTALFVFNSCTGSIFILASAYLINQLAALEYIGRNTISILGIHGFMTNTAFALCRRIIPEGIMLYVIVFGMVLAASVMCAFFIDQLAPNLNGKPSAR